MRKYPRVTVVLKALKLIENQAASFVLPSVTVISDRKKDPYLVLISCILSLRTKDKTTMEASSRLFEAADNPVAMLKLNPRRIEKLIYPVGFYRNKAAVILDISRRIITEFCGKVPGTLEELLSFKGVGRKTANLVLGLGFGVPAICVDTHVNRIPNRIGWIKTESPEETEEELKKIIPKSRWIQLNTLLVAFGQNICKPVKPLCGLCHIEKMCEKRIK
ncbi:MAG: endonuclease III [Candidatus Omnitrophota bacterium]|jgi:endonuclease-3|nr:MAG: endonuclease III [Candidatus Omnitrophota bacterium]